MSKNNYGLKTLLLVIGLGLATLAACTKPEDPNQNNQNQDPSKKYDTIYWGNEQSGWAPLRDTVINRLAQPGVEKVFIHLMGIGDVNLPYDMRPCRPSWCAEAGRDLKADIDIDSLNVMLSGAWKITKIAEPGTEPGDDDRGVVPWAVAQYLMQHGLGMVTENKKTK